MKRNILLNPGPATTTDSVKQAQIVPDICPREEEFSELICGIRRDLVKIAKGSQEHTAILFGGSGTAVMEAVMCSCVPDNRIALILSNGLYGERFYKIARAHEIPTIVIASSWDKNIDLKKVDETLDHNQAIETVFVIHHETTTGILNPIRKIGKIVKKHNRIFVVDAISSFAGIPFSIKDIKADFIMSTSNKCLQGMAGISFVIARKDQLEKCKVNCRSTYLDLYRQWKYLEEKGQFQFTPPVQVMYALRRAIDEFFDEGAQNRADRYRSNMLELLDGMTERGFKQYLGDVEHSCILETFYLIEGMDFKTFHDRLYEKGFTIYPSGLSPGTFRLAIMGNLNRYDIKNFLKAVDEVIK